MSVRQWLFAELTDVTLADEDSNWIPTDDVNRAILPDVAMQVTPSWTVFYMHLATQEMKIAAEEWLKFHFWARLIFSMVVCQGIESMTWIIFLTEIDLKSL